LNHHPRLSKLLQALRLDVVYHRAAGDFVFYRDENGIETEVLDLVCGYGSLLLGHSHPALVAEAQQFLSSGRPLHVQGSMREGACQLATELSRRANGDFCAVFGNSGAEAVEAAMKHAMLETGNHTFVCLENAFHGKTLGAVQLDANETYRKPFKLNGMNVARVRVNDIAHLEATFAGLTEIAGFIFEPIQGEGGIRLLEPAFLQRAAELCAEHHVPLIADECQTGTGRTGRFLACQNLGVDPDYILLAKSLGGGVAKISALLIRRDRYDESFDLLHTSTFAEDEFSCALAMKTLELIDEATLATCRSKGDRLLGRLRSIGQEFPDIIADVRGAGLMIGIEFRRLSDSSSFVLRFLSSQDNLVFALMGYLLNRHQIRATATLSDPFTLRIQPSVLIRDADLDRLICALEDICTRLRDGDAVALTEFLAEPVADAAQPTTTWLQTDWKLFAKNESRFREQQRDIPPKRVAWLFHGIDVYDFVAQEPSFDNLSSESLKDYLERFSTFASPVVMSGVDVRSLTDENVRLYPIMLPVTSSWMKRRIESRRRGQCQQLIEQAVEVARHLGCDVVSLGQYTSIATRNGRGLNVTDMGLTTGNSFAIALAIQAIDRAMRERGINRSDSVLAIAGAAGNIGSTCAEFLGREFRRTILLGSNKRSSAARLNKLSSRIPNSEISTEITDIRHAHVVLSAMSTVETPLEPTHFAENTIVCDVSVPSSIHPKTPELRPDIEILKGGIVRLPFGEDLEIDGFPLPNGYTFGCMAEGILLGFEGVRDATFAGSLTADQISRIANIAIRHGFELADRQTCMLGAERREAHVNTR